MAKALTIVFMASQCASASLSSGVRLVVRAQEDARQHGSPMEIRDLSWQILEN